MGHLVASLDKQVLGSRSAVELGHLCSELQSSRWLCSDMHCDLAGLCLSVEWLLGSVTVFDQAMLWVVFWLDWTVVKDIKMGKAVCWAPGLGAISETAAWPQ